MSFGRGSVKHHMPIAFAPSKRMSLILRVSILLRLVDGSGAPWKMTRQGGYLKFPNLIAPSFYVPPRVSGLPNAFGFLDLF